ncbi:MAG TPA: glycosyltransferase family 4 protein [Rectinemataceae bacterium]|nr:glycosyltransferase family 4 protein [Rectinemataceae bacterium]
MEHGRILIFANTFWYLYKFRSNLAARLGAEGFEVVACAPDRDEYREKMACRTESFALDRHSVNPFKELASFARIFALLRREKPVCVLTFTPKMNLYAALAARLLGIPSIPNISGVGKSFAASPLVRLPVEIAYRASLGGAAHVFFQNDADRDYFVSRGMVKGGHSRLFGSGVDLARFAPDSPPGRGERRTFLFAARLIREKGALDYLAAARELSATRRDLRFLCCGAFEDDDVRAELEACVRSGLVEYLGLVDDMKSLLEKVDCVVLPTYYNEGVPRILIEAIAMGRVVISTAIPGCRDVVVEGETGFFVSPRDGRGLAAKMAAVAELGRAELERMGAAGMELAKRRFDERTILDEYVEKLHSIGEAAANGRPRREAK